MTTNTKMKLQKVLEYLTKNDDEKARELLHQVFIEKARAIHEELMGEDDDNMDAPVGGSGDRGNDLRNEIAAMDDNIDFEETMNEEGDDEVADDGMDDMSTDDDADAGGEEDGEFAGVTDKMNDLETALAELKAEFEKLEAEEEGDDEGEEEGDDEGEEEGDDEGEEDAWNLDEDFDDLAESLDLEVVEKNMEKSAKTADEVGSGRSGMAIDKSAKSPLPSSQQDRMGAKPVAIGNGGTHNGYNRETAPKTEQLAGMKADNRRKKSTDGASKMTQQGNASAALNKTASEFGIGSTGKMSPLSKGGSNLK